ncbi:unnamed protein product [Symbiodinium necroappetens]|uniref:Uncharacterized protein n=1 Tax=Symbiodinium necroappetens TaxID=1628268 RepID=A0A812U587_9DINO|nr:unnamed protein product [Symbiodinium necroappetens]
MAAGACREHVWDDAWHEAPYRAEDEEVKDEEVHETASASADQIPDLESCEQWDEGLEPKCELDPYLADRAGTKDEDDEETEASTGGLTLLTGELLSFLHADKSNGSSFVERMQVQADAAVLSASRRLWQLGALEPGELYGQVQLTVLGTWMATALSKPPSELPSELPPALFFGSAWKCLVPVAAAIVLLQPLPGGLTPNKDLRKLWQKVRKTPPSGSQTCWSGHFVMVAAYLKWKEWKAQDKERHRKGDVVWEALDARVMAMCRYAKVALGYCGDDVAAALDGEEHMPQGTSRRRAWTVQAMLGDGDGRRECVLAALCAALVPRPGDGWRLRGEAIDGFEVEVESTVSSAHACIFGASAPQRVSDKEVEFGGAQCRLKPGLEGSLAEVHEIRSQLSSQTEAMLHSLGDQEVHGRQKPDFGFSDDLISATLAFLSSPRGDFLYRPEESAVMSEGAAEEVGLGVLTLLGRAEAGSLCGQDQPVPKRHGYKDALSGRMVPAKPLLWQGSAARSGDVKEELPEAKERPERPTNDAKERPEVSEEREERCLEDWATSLVQAALLAALKRRSAAAERFDVAAMLKQRELGAEAAAAAGRTRALRLLSAPKLAAVEQLNERKRKAVELEDYELAGSLKREALTLEAEIQAMAQDTVQMQARVREQAVRLAAAMLGRKGDGSESDLWIEVERHLEENAGLKPVPWCCIQDTAMWAKSFLPGPLSVSSISRLVRRPTRSEPKADAKDEVPSTDPERSAGPSEGLQSSHADDLPAPILPEADRPLSRTLSPRESEGDRAFKMITFRKPCACEACDPQELVGRRSPLLDLTGGALPSFGRSSSSPQLGAPRASSSRTRSLSPRAGGLLRLEFTLRSSWPTRHSTSSGFAPPARSSGGHSAPIRCVAFTRRLGIAVLTEHWQELRLPGDTGDEGGASTSDPHTADSSCEVGIQLAATAKRSKHQGPADDTPLLEEEKRDVTKLPLTFETMFGATGDEVSLENREAVEAILMDLHSVAHPLCEHFRIRYDFLLEQHCQERKAGVARRTPKWMGGEERYLTTVRLRVRRHPAKGDPQKAPEGSMCSRLMHISSFLQDFIGRGLQSFSTSLHISGTCEEFMFFLKDIFTEAARRKLLDPTISNELPSCRAWENLIYQTGGDVADEELMRLFDPSGDPTSCATPRNGFRDLAPEIAAIQTSASQPGLGGLGHRGAEGLEAPETHNVPDSAVPNPDDQQESPQAPGPSSPEEQGNGGAPDALPKREEKAPKALMKGSPDRSRKPKGPKGPKTELQGQTKASQAQPGGQPPKKEQKPTKQPTAQPTAQPKARPMSPGNHRDRPRQGAAPKARQGAARAARPSSVPCGGAESKRKPGGVCEEGQASRGRVLKPKGTQLPQRGELA